MTHTASLRSLPTLPGLPVLGNALEFRDRRLDLMGRAAATGDLALMYVFHQPVVMVNTPNLAYQVLIKQHHALTRVPWLRAIAANFIGNGLLNSDGAFWRRQRRLMAPAFQHRHIETYAAIMAAHTDQMHRDWEDGAIIDLDQAMLHLAMRSIASALFGIDITAAASRLARALTQALYFANEEINRPFRLPLSWPTPRNRAVRQARRHLHAVIDEIIAARRAAQAAPTSPEHQDLLSLLLAARDDDGTQMTDEQVRDEALTLFLAGYENTANALTWSWYALTQHPEAYARLQEEADRVVPGRAPTAADLASLPYALQVCKEAMRLYPPAYVLVRYTAQPLTLGPYHIPAGVIVAVNTYTLHRTPAYFPDPDRFDPDRFAPDAESRLPRCAYLPFGDGPRICIGNHFALMEAQIVLATLARHVTFSLVPCQHIAPDPSVTLRPPRLRVAVGRRTAQ